MMNPAAMMKIMKAKGVFEQNHPKFIAFLRAVFASKIEEGTIIEIKVQKPGEDPLVTNIKVKQSDLELVDELKNLSM
ncbi:MAG: hypothetical protein Q4D51_03970 [Eubacteriales bacterium]|nr:hypothetical protein [Eubacteriales bacterium]